METDDVVSNALSHTIDTSSVFSSRDMGGGYDAQSAVTVSLDGESALCNSDAVDISGSCIIVDSEKTDKIQLVLNGADITSVTGAAIYVRQADKVFITLAEGSENSLANGGEFAASEDNIDAVIFSKDDLTLNGSGSLSVNSPAGHGIVSKDELVVTGGEYSIVSAGHGLAAKDSLGICGGSFDIDSVDDAVHSDSALTVSGGTYAVSTGDDGFHADGALTVSAGEISILQCYEGIEGKTVDIAGGNISICAADDGINAADGSGQGGFGGFGSAAADYRINISGGSIFVTADGDGLDSNGTLSITGGSVTVSGANTGDTSILDYEASGAVSGGTFFGTGSGSMAQNFDSSSSQGVIMVRTGSQAAGAEIELTDSDGSVLLKGSAAQDFSCVIISCPEIVSGGSYSLRIGENITEITMNGLIYGEGGTVGKGGSEPPFPDNGDRPDGDGAPPDDNRDAPNGGGIPPDGNGAPPNRDEANGDTPSGMGYPGGKCP